MTGICRASLVIFGVAWLAALALLVIGTFGWVGQEKDPLSGIFLVPLGFPWNQFLSGLPETFKPLGAALAPGLNLLLMWLICGLLLRSNDDRI